jgi:hypothetical protein
MGKMEKCGKVRQATDVNVMQHRKDVICMLDTAGQNTKPH